MLSKFQLLLFCHHYGISVLVKINVHYSMESGALSMQDDLDIFFKYLSEKVLTRILDLCTIAIAIPSIMINLLWSRKIQTIAAINNGLLQFLLCAPGTQIWIKHS